MFKGEINDKSNDYERTHAISGRLKKTKAQIKTKKAGKIMSLKHIQSKPAKLKAPRVFVEMGIGKTSFKLEGNRKSRRMQAKKNRKK